MNLFITIDTELSLSTYQREGAFSLEQNFIRAIDGVTTTGEFGIGYQMDILDRYGLKGVFFVDPMPALLWGTAPIKRMVAPIVARGHDVQLHIHTEWLNFVENSPVQGRLGSNIGDFNLHDQIVLLQCARDFLVEAGAPPPIAFRAGNFGADDRTLDALAAIEVTHDSSFNPGFQASPCRISLPKAVVNPIRHRGIIEVPVSAIDTGWGKQRHAQLVALSWWEMRAAIEAALRNGFETFTIVSHSFELLSRDRTQVNHIVRRRFEKLCAWLAEAQGVTVTALSSSPPQPAVSPVMPRLKPNSIRTLARMGEQLVSNRLYGSA